MKKNENQVPMPTVTPLRPKFSEEAEIGLGTDMPLKLTLNMVTGAGKLSFLLAPRLESDE